MSGAAEERWLGFRGDGRFYGGMIRLPLTPMVALFALCVAGISTSMAKPKLEPLWVSDAVFNVPESVLFDGERGVVYVSNMGEGDGWENDGNGSIGKLRVDGTVVDAHWVSGLHGPKGMGLLGKTLYVNDNDTVISIDVESGEIVGRVKVEGTKHLNDLSVAADGTIYLTDSTRGVVYRFVNGVATPVVQGLGGLNGVLHSDGELLFVDSGALKLYGKNGDISILGEGMEGFTDGIERVDEDSWLVSCWAGTVYLVTRSGDVTLLLDGRPTETSAADLGYDREGRVAYFPGFYRNFVAAYRLDLD